MEKPFAAVEFGSKKLKLVVGYELEGQVYVVYSLLKPYGSIIENGEIIDPLKVVQSLKEIKNFVDPSAQLKMTIADVLLSLPPFGLKIYTNSMESPVMNDDSRVSKYDIRSVHQLLKKGSLPTNVLVDIIPVFYELDKGRRYIDPPVGEVSSSVKLAAMEHSLPKSIKDSYEGLVKNAGINLKRSVIAPYAASVLLGSYPDIPQNYLLVDIGGTMTTVSLIGEKRLYCSNYFSWGGDRITERIIESFNINESDAERYKIMYGIDNQVMNFKAPVCRSYDEEGNEIKHYTDELNEIIKEELSIFTKDLNDAVADLLKEYDLSSKNLPMILIGGGSQLNGLVEYIEPKVPSESVRVVTPRSLGARDATFTNVLGVILANKKNPPVFDENNPRVGTLTRDE